MKRIPFTPRPHWREQCESLGFSFHSIDGLYWEERYAYEFTSAQIDTLDDATAQCHQLCIQAVDHVIRTDRLDQFVLPEPFKEWVVQSWQQHKTHESFSLFSRFDFSWNGSGEPKLLEYNADTPTGLLEASVVQWHWLQDVLPNADQFNSLHEQLIDRWKLLKASTTYKVNDDLHFACAAGSEEDWGNLIYLQDTANQAGWQTQALTISDLGWDSKTAEFCDLQNSTIRRLFKLYPWEWLMSEQFNTCILENAQRHAPALQWIEPPWKILMSSKALLPILWELFPKHPNLLPCYFEKDAAAHSINFHLGYAKKPLYSREGANVLLHFSEKREFEAPGDYGNEGYVIQGLAPLPQFGEHHTCIGSWLVGDWNWSKK